MAYIPNKSFTFITEIIASPSFYFTMKKIQKLRARILLILMIRYSILAKAIGFWN